MAIEFRILGPFEVLAEGKPLALGSAHRRALLALLAVQAPAASSMDQLIDELWGERPPPSARHAVHVYVSGLRKILGTAADDVALRASPAGYVLDLDPESIDCRRFERLIADAQVALAGDPESARELFAQALELWRGRPLAEFDEFEFARREGGRLDELHVIARERMAEARLACGEHAEVIGTISELVAVNPLRERPRWLLMLALYRDGRHADALDAYRDGCAALDEIGLQPGPELRQLEQAILNHDPSLQPPDVSATAEAPGIDATPSPAPPPAAVARRKVVTVLFGEFSWASASGDALDPEVLATATSHCAEALHAAAERHGATVEPSGGDTVLAVFGIPRVREDDALRAVRAATEMRDRLARLPLSAGAEATFRAGISTGVVLAGEHDDHTTTGATVNTAVRLSQAASQDEILLGPDTLALVRDAVTAEPAERPEQGPAFRLLAVDALAAGFARHLEASLVARERELQLLRDAWERSLAERGCQLFTVLGMAGVGKSRLVAELLAELGDSATVLRGRCLPYGEGTTFWALVEALGELGEPAAAVLEHLGSGGAAVPQELYWEVRRLLESLALSHPVVLCIDDLQWAQPMLLDLLDNVADLSHRAPILLVCTARPELLEERGSWGAGRPNTSTVRLEPLDLAASAQLLDQLGEGLGETMRARVIATSEGNPLFLEEMAALAREQGVVAVPGTIHALLAARLERLSPQERDLVERGAIEGEVFHRLAVCALATESQPADVELRLGGLVRKDMIRPHPPTFPDDEAFRFRHALIRDAAYEAVPKAARAELHERFASWLERVGAALADLDEIVGWHLEQAASYHRELTGETDATLARRAADHLHLAGRRADHRRETTSSLHLQERALALAPPDDPLAAQIAVDIAGILLQLGELDRAGELLSGAAPAQGADPLASLYRLELRIHTRPDEATETIESLLPEALAQLEQSDDQRGLAKAHLAAYRVHWSAGRVAAARDAAGRAAEHARAAGDEGLRAHALGNYIGALQQGAWDPSELTPELDEIEREQQGPYLAASINRLRATLCCLEGRFDDARELVALAVTDCEALGMGIRAAVFTDILVETEFSAGDPAAALRALLRADEILAEQGERSNRSTFQAYLAEAYELVGDGAAASAAIATAEELSAPDDIVNFAITYAVRARLALSGGDDEAAERWARSAVEHAERTEFVWDRARARLTLAQVLSALERKEEAAAELRQAVELYERKGDRPRAEQARSLLAEIGEQSG